MGKASRRPRGSGRSAPAAAKAAPYVRRPFEGLPSETDWVAIREILPAATASVRLADSVIAEGPDDAPSEVVIATVLPMAWPGLHRADGTVFVATQSGSASGDASRDLASAVLATRALPPGAPLQQAPAVTADTPRLQDLLADGQDFDVTVHEGFDFWVGEADLEDDAKASLERANESVVPTTRIEGVESAYHVVIGDRAYIRMVLGDDEDPATGALARLHAAGEDALGEGTRLLGAFRACGLLVPVVEVPVDSDPADHTAAVAQWRDRYAVALANDAALTAEERRARAGLLSRQVTLR